VWSVCDGVGDFRDSWLSRLRRGRVEKENIPLSTTKSCLIGPNTSIALFSPFSNEESSYNLRQIQSLLVVMSVASFF